MEKQQKKQIMKYIYFLCIGIVIGFMFGSISRHGFSTNKASNNIRYDADTVTSENGWYSDNIEWVELADSTQN